MSVAPDEGLMLMTQRYAADRQAAATAAPPQPGPGMEAGAELAVFARLAASLDGMTREISRSRIAAEADWSKVHPIEMSPGTGYTTAGTQNAAGTYDNPDEWGPRAGWAWRLFGWTIALGAGATGFSIWLDSPNDPSNIQFTSSASGRWEPAHKYVMPGRRLVVTSTGGPLIIGKADLAEIAVDYLPRFIGLST